MQTSEEEIINTNDWTGKYPMSELSEERHFTYKPPLILSGIYDWVLIARQNETRRFKIPVDLRYGVGPNGPFSYKYNVSGELTLNNTIFTDPAPGIQKNVWYRLTKERIIPGLINTGFNLSIGETDPNWVFHSFTPDNPGLPDNGDPFLVCSETIVGKQSNPNTTTSKWLGKTIASPGYFIYKISFDLTGLDITTVNIKFKLDVNDDHQAWRVNSYIYWTNIGNWPSETTITYNTPGVILLQGINTIYIKWLNGLSIINAAGIRVEFTDRTASLS